MSSSTSHEKNILIGHLIDAYQKQLLMSYTSGLAAPRKYGPDIMDLTGKLHEVFSTGSKLCLLCDKILDATWKEYSINTKDINYYSEKAYWESLSCKEEALKELINIEAQWEMEALEEDNDGGRGRVSVEVPGDDDEGYGDAESESEEEVDDEEEEGEEEDEGIGQVFNKEDFWHTSPDFMPGSDLTLTPTSNGEQAQIVKVEWFPSAATAAMAIAVIIAVNSLVGGVKFGSF